MLLITPKVRYVIPIREIYEPLYFHRSGLSAIANNHFWSRLLELKVIQVLLDRLVASVVLT